MNDSVGLTPALVYESQDQSQRRQQKVDHQNVVSPGRSVQQQSSSLIAFNNNHVFEKLDKFPDNVSITHFAEITKLYAVNEKQHEEKLNAFPSPLKLDRTGS